MYIFRKYKMQGARSAPAPPEVILYRVSLRVSRGCATGRDGLISTEPQSSNYFLDKFLPSI